MLHVQYTGRAGAEDRNGWVRASRWLPVLVSRLVLFGILYGMLIHLFGVAAGQR